MQRDRKPYSSLYHFKGYAPLIVLDAGCRNGFTDLKGLHSLIHYIGLDPAANAFKKEGNFLTELYLQKGLYHSNGTFDFYDCQHSSFSSMLKFDEAQFLKHFGLMRNSAAWLKQLTVKQKLKIETSNLSKVVEEQNLQSIDFLKLDTQGTELDILKGGEHLLKAKKIKVIKCEVAFIGVYKQQALYHEIAAYLNQFDYSLANLQVYPNAAAQNGKAAMGLNSFKENIRFASGGDAIFYLNNQEASQLDLVKTGMLLASEKVFSLAYQFLKSGGLGEKEIVELFSFLTKQQRLSFVARLKQLVKWGLYALRTTLA